MLRDQSRVLLWDRVHIPRVPLGEPHPTTRHPTWRHIRRITHSKVIWKTNMYSLFALITFYFVKSPPKTITKKTKKNDINPTPEKSKLFSYIQGYVYLSLFHSFFLSCFWPDRSTYNLQILTQHFLSDPLKAFFNSFLIQSIFAEFQYFFMISF